MLEIFVVFIIGLIGGTSHILLFKEGEFCKPKVFKTETKTYIHFGFISDLFIGVIAAFVATLPTWSFVPLAYKLLPALFASIAGSSFIISTSNILLQKNIKKKTEELDSLVVKKNNVSEKKYESR